MAITSTHLFFSAVTVKTISRLTIPAVAGTTKRPSKLWRQLQDHLRQVVEFN